MSAITHDLAIPVPLEFAARTRPSTTSLHTLPHGQKARVVAVNGAGAVTRRLMEMGVVPGARVSIVKVAPLGDPIQVRVRGYDLALRRAEAQTISVVLSDN